MQDMGISIITMPDGRVQLLHTFGSAASKDDAEEGMPTVSHRLSRRLFHLYS
jgi:hypothetical protein